MNPEIKSLWLAALRSGTYSQGRERLRGEADSFCCLGVLCDIHAPQNWVEIEWASDWEFHLPDEGEVYRAEGELPKSFYQALDIDYAVEDKLIHMNDIEQKTFPEIADWIEANL